MTLTVQFMTMLSMIAGGVYLGAALDTYRRITRFWQKKRTVVYLFESLFWLGQTVLLFYLLFKVNYGELRVYVYIACLLGFSMYQVLFKKTYGSILEFIIRIVRAIVLVIGRVGQLLLFKPLSGLIQIIIVCLLGVIQLVGTVLLFIGKVAFFPVRFLFKTFWWMTPAFVQKILHKMGSNCSIIINRCKRFLNKLYSWRR